MVQSVEYLVGIYLRKIFCMMGSIHVTPGPLTIYRKHFFDRYGGYDGNNITEDIEIALRIQSKRFIIENSVDACVYTVGPDNFSDLTKQRKRWYLGFMNNVQRYRKLFHPSYGNLGLFILPGSFISVALVILICFYTIFKLFSDFSHDLANYLAINFDILPLLKFDLDFFKLNLSPLAVLSVVSLIIGITIIMIAKSWSKEKSNIKFSYLAYIIIYWFIFAYWWVAAGACKLTKQKIVWGKKILD
jgi:cellulose synthase/poly-beta-1,6-N-acetylglucosamine synthase-like glycosyltransferase